MNEKNRNKITQRNIETKENRPNKQTKRETIFLFVKDETQTKTLQKMRK